MVDYLGEIADRWDEIDEKSRTQLLDKLFGKRGASVGSAILGNFDQVRKALEEMENAAGSADAEMDIIRDSVAFKLNELKQTWIGYAQELLQRDDIGKIIDALIEASENFEDTLDSLAPSIEVIINFIAELIKLLGDVIEVTGEATPYIIMFMLAFKKRGGLVQVLTDLKNFKKFVVDFPGKAKTFITTLQTIQKLMSGMNPENVAYDLTMKGLSGASGADEVTGIMKNATIIADKLSSSLSVIIPLLMFAASAVAAAYATWYNSVDQVVERSEDARKELIKLRDEAKKIADESGEKSKSLTELIDQYQTAVKGSKEYYDIANKIAEIAPNTVIGHTIDGDAILGDISLLQEELQLLKDINAENREKEKQHNAEIVDAYSDNPTTDEGKKAQKTKKDVEKKLKIRQDNLKFFNDQILKYERVLANPDSSEKDKRSAKYDLESYKRRKEEALADIDKYNKQLRKYDDDARQAYEGLMPTEDDISDGKKAMRQMLLNMATEAKMDSGTFLKIFDSADNISDVLWDKLFSLNEKKSSMSYEDYKKNAEEIFKQIIEELKKSLPEGTTLDDDMILGIRVSLGIDPQSQAEAEGKVTKWASKNKVKKTRYEGSELVKGNEEMLNWYRNLSPESQAIADSEEFTKELEKQKRKFGETRIACVEALKAVREYGNTSEEAGEKTVAGVLGEDGQKQLDDYYSTVSDIQEVINKINTGDYTAMDLNQWRVQYNLVGESAQEMVEELKGVEEESRKTVIELIDKFIKANPGETELIKTLELIKKGIEDVRKEAEKKINFNPGVDKLDKFNDGLNSLQDSYIKFFKEGDLIDTDDLMGIREIFGELDEYQEFENAVLSGNGDLDASFDKLVTAYAKTTDVLSGLTEENQQYYITALKNKGIVNAEEVVTQKLTQDRQREAQRTKELEDLHAALADTNQNLVDKTKNLENATWQNIAALVAEGEQSGVTAQELALYALKKALAAGINLANSSDINYLLSLAKAAGVAADSITQLANAKSQIGTLESKLKTAQAKAGGRTTTEVQYLEEQIKNKSKEMKDLGNKIQDEVNNFEVEKYDINFDYNGTTAKDASGGGGGSEETAETFDWIETKIQRLERDITNLGKTADATYKTWAERTVALGQEMEKVNEQISLQETAYNAYMAKAESVGLSAQYKNLVQSGALKIDEITDETLKEQIQNYSDWYQKALDAKDKVDDLKQSLAELAKTKFDNISAQFDDLISDIDHGLKYVTAQLESVETVGKIAGKSFYEEQIKAEQQRVNDLTAELGQLQAALNEGLASGAIEYGSQMFNEMKSSIYSVEESILDANNAILKFEQNIKDVAKQNFDDLLSQFENAISILTSKIDLTDNIISMVESTGHIVSKRYYESLAEAEDQNIKNLKKKYDELSKVFDEAVANGDIEPYTDSWYDMKDTVESVKGEIIDATSKLIEYKNAMRQIDWDLFDRGQTRLEQLVSESQFLIDLYEKYPLFDKEIGDITDKGMATRGLLVQNYETYISQARQLQEEIAKLKEELKADPGSTTLIDRIKELEQAERDAILSSEGIKESLRDLLENEINALLEALQKLVDEYKKNLQAQKDLHDYQKNIDQQNKNINSLRKQLMAYGNGDDTTEENRARVQKLNQQLKEAEDQLRETEFDRYIQETQTLLDDFMNSLREYFDEKLLDLNWVLERAIEDTNLNAETIRAQIEQTGVETGYVYTEEFAKIWESMTASDSLFSEQRDILAATDQVCTDIKAGVDLLPTMDGLSAYLDGETLQIVSEIANVDNAVGGVQSAIQETNTALAQIQSKIAEYNASVLSSIADAKAAAERANQAAQAAQATANEAKSKASSGGGTSSGGSSSNSSSEGSRIKYVYNGRDYTSHAAAFSAQQADATQRANKSHNMSTRQAYYDDWIRNHPVETVRYAKGGLIGKDKNPLDFLAQQLGEDHMVAAKEGERILTAKQNESFEKLANAFSSLSSEDMAKYSILTGNKMIGKMPTLQMPTLRSMEQSGNTEINGGISINLPNVTNKAEFVEWLRNDGQIEKIIQSMTLGKLQGKNSYDKMKY